jgi:hypothetical protein
MKTHIQLPNGEDANETLRFLGSVSPNADVILEAAWFAFRHHYEDLAQYLDLSDDELQPIMEKLDKQLNDQ